MDMPNIEKVLQNETKLAPVAVIETKATIEAQPEDVNQDTLIHGKFKFIIIQVSIDSVVSRSYRSRFQYYSFPCH